MTSIILFSDGSWNWESEVNEMALIQHAHTTIKLGEGWSDRDVQDMLSEYYEANRFLLFEQSR